MYARLLSALLCVSAGPAPDTLVVCPPAFTAALDRWVALRESQGHSIRFHTDTSSAAAIRAGIRDAARLRRLRFVLLAGDAEPSRGTT